MALADLSQKAKVFEPIMEKKDCRLVIEGAEVHNWKPKDGTGVDKETKGMKLQLKISDPGAVTENADAQPSLRIDDYINLEPHPYVNKDGEVAMLRPNKVYQLCRALGFDLLYVDDEGSPVEPKVSKTGRKYCPPGGHEKLNPDFIAAYFDDNDEPRFDAWIGQEIVAHVKVDKGSEEYGPSNKIQSYQPKQE